MRRYRFAGTSDNNSAMHEDKNVRQRHLGGLSMYLCVSSIERQGPLLQGRFMAHLSMLLTLHTLVFFAFEYSAAQQEAASPHAASSLTLLLLRSGSIYLLL